MPRRLRIGNRSTCVWAAISALVCIGGCNAGSSAPPGPVLTSSPAAPAADPPSNPTPTAPTGPPATGEGSTYSTVGPLMVEQQADVAAERDGRITAVKAEIGDHVRRGQVLALLDDRALQAGRAQKAAKVGSLRAQVQSWESEQKKQEAALRHASAMHGQKKLGDEGQELVQSRLTETRTQVTLFQAHEAAAEAELRAADIELGQSRVTAPFNGVIGRRSVHEAQEVKKGEALFWITAQAPLRITFTVPESSMAFFPPGARLELTTKVYPHLRQPASVFRVSPVVDPASGNIEVIGNVEKPSPLLKPGMSMQVKLGAR